MKTALYGRIVFGASAVLFGVTALIWRAFDQWESFGVVIGWILAIAQIAGGIAMLYWRTARFGAVVLVAVYLLLTLDTIPGIFSAPANYQSYGSVFEVLSEACGAIAVYALTETNAARSSLIGVVARVSFGLCMVSAALDQLFYLKYTASLVPTWIPPNQMFWAVLTTIAFALAAIAILIKVQARLALRLTTLMLALFGVLIWVPHLIAHPEAYSNWTEFTVNFIITGSAWLVADLKSF